VALTGLRRRMDGVAFMSTCLMSISGRMAAGRIRGPVDRKTKQGCDLHQSSTLDWLITPGQPATHGVQRVAERLLFGDHALCPLQHLRALRGEALEPLPALNNLHPEFGLELADAR
jgi:hypothetical protein